MEADPTDFFQELSSSQDRLQKIWDDIGFDEAEKRRRVHYVSVLLLEQLKKLEAKEMTLKEDLISSIDETGLKISQLTKDLSVKSIVEPEINMTLIQLEKYLKEQLIIFQQEAEHRFAELEKLKDREKELCLKMGENVCQFPDEKIPSEETIHYLQMTVNTLKSEFEERTRTFRTLKSAILYHMEELGESPSSALERELMVAPEDLIKLSNAKMDEIKFLCKELQSKVKSNREREKLLQQEINLLWERLSIDLEDQETFLSSLTSNATRNIPKLEEQLQELKELRHQNLGHFINTLRREMDEWWEKCYISEDEKEAFLPYFSDEYTEESLLAHETEVARLRSLYADHQNIFKKITAWKELWLKVTELDERANDPNRLFGNRGCSLLQEEKERKRVNLELPRVERDLEKEIALWEAKRGSPFFLCGQTLINFIKSHWTEYNEKKRREKEQRQVARNRQLHMEARLGTVKPSLKRKSPRLESLRSFKYQKTGEVTRTISSSSSSSLFKANIPKVLNSTRDLKDNTILSVMSQKTLNSSEVSSYDKFTLGIEKKVTGRENIRSSVVPKATSLRSTPKKTLRTLLVTLNHSSRRPLADQNKFHCFTPTSSRVNTSSVRPKYPMTVPRRSTRLESKQRMASPAFKSPYLPPPSRLLTPMRNKLKLLL